MSNLNKAAEVLREAYREPSISPVHACDIMADALEAAGLLMPGLPEPDAEKLNGDVKFFVGMGGQVRYDVESEWVQLFSKHLLTSAEARSLALALLAACEYAEKEEDNESRK